MYQYYLENICEVTLLGNKNVFHLVIIVIEIFFQKWKSQSKSKKKNIMKRSVAPSLKLETSTSSQTTSSTSTAVDANKRGTASLLNVLKDTETNQDSPEASTEEKLPLAPTHTLLTENAPVLEPKLIRSAYSVLWAKKGTGKHKIWEGDGILEVTGKRGVVKDEEGTRIGQMINFKPDLIKPGLIIEAGQVDIEIKELIPKGSQKVISVKRIYTEDNPPGAKRTRTSYPGALVTPIHMPKPSKEHEMAYNTKKECVVDVTISYCLAKVLRQHQIIGVVFLYGCVSALKQIGRFGAILADDMGLGKSLQCITLVWTLLQQGPYGGIPVIKRALIVTPSTLTRTWEKEFYKWLGRDRIRVFVANSRKQADYRHNSHPVFIIAYEMFVRHFDEVSKLTFDLMICDEGHQLKDNNAFTLLDKLPCKRRIILTCTPIQNDLQEFFALINFVNPGFLGTNDEYTKYFEVPILASRQPNVDEQMKKLGKIRAKELNGITSDFILRRTQDVLDSYLPRRTETVVFCKSSPLQRKLYAAAVEAWNTRDIHNKDLCHLSVITILKKICNHPSLIKPQKNESEDEFPGSLNALLTSQTGVQLHESGKVKVLLSLLKRVDANHEKIVIVSSYTQTLGMLANLCDVKDYKYARLDGTVSSSDTHPTVNTFNTTWSKTFVFLLSAKADGVGLKLCGASRLVLFDSDWNPATDLQAMSRIWREGQKKSVYLYRFITTGTLEEKIYQRQISKTGLSCAIVDSANTSSIRLSDEELKDIFTYRFDDDCSTHSLLNCACKCDGSIPEPIVIKEDSERDSQLDFASTSEGSRDLKMNQLMKWEHHKPPYDGKNMEALLLKDSYSDITFIFRDQSKL